MRLDETKSTDRLKAVPLILLIPIAAGLVLTGCTTPYSNYGSPPVPEYTRQSDTPGPVRERSTHRRYPSQETDPHANRQSGPYPVHYDGYEYYPEYSSEYEYAVPNEYPDWNEGSVAPESAYFDPYERPYTEQPYYRQNDHWYDTPVRDPYYHPYDQEHDEYGGDRYPGTDPGPRFYESPGSMRNERQEPGSPVAPRQSRNSTELGIREPDPRAVVLEREEFERRYGKREPSPFQNENAVEPVKEPEPTITAPTSTELSNPEAKSNTPSSRPVRNLLAKADHAIASKDFEQAQSTLERAVRIAPSDANVLTRLARVKLNIGDAAQAEALALKSNALLDHADPLRLTNLEILVSAREQQGDKAGAAAAKREAGRLR